MLRSLINFYCFNVSKSYLKSPVNKQKSPMWSHSNLLQYYDLLGYAKFIDFLNFNICDCLFVCLCVCFFLKGSRLHSC